MSDVQKATLRAISARLRFGSDTGIARVWLTQQYLTLTGEVWAG
jgi:hypothetical protein